MKQNFTTLSLSELEPYILRKAEAEGSADTKILTRDVFALFMKMLQEDPIAKDFFESYDSYKDFYKTAVDFAHLIPKDLQMEVFYAAKIGCFYTGIPSFCVYMIKRAWTEANGIPNLIPKLLPSVVLNEVFKKGYFTGLTSLRDVICNVACKDYNPLSETNLRNRVGDFTEIYIKSTDMVAAVPNVIADALDDNSILNITVEPNGLTTNGMLLRTMCNYVGAINSTYDLRELI